MYSIQPKSKFIHNNIKKISCVEVYITPITLFLFLKVKKQFCPKNVFVHVFCRFFYFA